MTNEDDNQILLDGERMRRLKESDDWKFVKGKLDALMTEYLSLSSVPDYKTATSLMNEINTRKKAVGIVRTWFEEVEGTGVQQQYNLQAKKINKESDLITHFEKE